MTSAETKKAPVAPTTGTTAEAAPTAPTNTEFIANETDKTMIASPTDNRQRLESVVTTASKCGALISRHFLDGDTLTEHAALSISDMGSTTIDGEGTVDVSVDEIECFSPVNARDFAELVTCLSNIADVLATYADPTEAQRDLLELVPPTRLVKQQSGDLIAEIRTKFGVSHEDVQRVSGLDADVLRRVESGDLPVSSPGAAAVLRAIIDTAEEPASSAIDFCSEV